MNFFGVTFRGLEPFFADELAGLPMIDVKETRYRRVRFECASDFKQLTNLKCCDDVFVEVEEWHEIARQRSSLALMRDLAAALNLSEALSCVRDIRNIPDDFTLSVTANFVGKRNYAAAEIKECVGNAIQEVSKHSYVDNDDVADINVRIFIEGESALVGVRLARAPLHVRKYVTANHPAKLKPPVAACMMRMADFSDSHAFLDPFCGSGTLLHEGALVGLQAFGGDIQADSVARISGLPVCQWDASSLPFASNSFSRIISNLPWGSQIHIDGDDAYFYEQICQEMERVLCSDGKIVVLTAEPDLVRFRSLKLTMDTEISLFGKRPFILKFEAQNRS